MPGNLFQQLSQVVLLQQTDANKGVEGLGSRRVA